MGEELGSRVLKMEGESELLQVCTQFTCFY